MIEEAEFYVMELSPISFPMDYVPEDLVFVEDVAPPTCDSSTRIRDSSA